MPKTTKKITTIPATLTRFTATPITEQKSARSPVMRVFPLTTTTSSPATRPRLITTPITSRAGTIGSSSMFIRTQA